jgi:hypothetical protein
MAKKSDMAADIIGAVKAGTKKWTKTVKAEERNPVSRSYRYARMTQKRGVSFKDAAEQIMEEAYNKVSDNGRLPANARQVMYAARPYIQEKTGKPLQDSYFTQTLLPNYLMDHDVAWNVIYDARGHFVEPHDGKTFGLGTLEVRNYLASLHDPKLEEAMREVEIETCGPNGNFSALLFVEKEGFMPLLKAARLAERFDIAIMSTKGVSVTAARELADVMCHDYDIPLLLLHDLDKSGFVISGTLQRDTRRYEFQNEITTIDLGLSLTDVEAMNLPFEHQFVPKGKKIAMMDNLRKNGATEAEIAFMFADFDATRRSLRRVELNAMSSPQFVDFIERKLRENNITKIIPDQDLLAESYRLFKRGQCIEKIVEKELKNLDGDDANVPDNLEQCVSEMFAKNPALRWTEAMQRIVKSYTDAA